MDEASPSNPPSPAGDPAGRIERRTRAALDALRALLRDTYQDQFGAVPRGLTSMELTLGFRAQPAAQWALEFDPPLAEQLRARFEDAQASLDVFQRGRVYCYRCESTACTHAQPGQPAEVFAGYDSTGRPVWQEFAQALIAKRDPRVDQLYSESAVILATVQSGREVRGDQLSAFGRASKTYAVLGQAIAGYFPVPDDGGAARLAATVQIVEARGAAGRIRLHLNVILRTPTGEGPEDWFASGWQPALERAIQVARREVTTLDAKVSDSRGPGQGPALRAALAGVPQILQRWVEHLERGGRQALRRTRHAEERRRDQRPVHKALDDARDVREDTLFIDERADTWMVAGARHRVHAFSREGRHVTSFVLPPHGLGQRLRTRRWRAATPDEFTGFRRAVAAVPKGSGTTEIERDTA